jgi:hypothetical protein
MHIQEPRGSAISTEKDKLHTTQSKTVTFFFQTATSRAETEALPLDAQSEVVP